MAFTDKNLLLLLLPVLRARDFHLYLEGGKAVLGHKPPRVLVELKNAAERGLFAPFPHPLEKRLYKALAAAKPGGGLWQRRGIYLALEQDITRENYETLFRRFLDSGFLIPPSPEEPAILPLEMSAGEESKLAELLAAR